MQCLLVKTPEQVVQYFEKQLNKYRAILEKGEIYPESVVVYVQHLIREYSLYITRIKEYMNYKYSDTNEAPNE
jgi:L-rhamnose mutarotase